MYLYLFTGPFMLLYQVGPTFVFRTALILHIDMTYVLNMK